MCGGGLRDRLEKLHKPAQAKTDGGVATKIREWQMETAELAEETQLEHAGLTWSAMFTAVNGILTPIARTHFDYEEFSGGYARLQDAPEQSGQVGESEEA